MTANDIGGDPPLKVRVRRRSPASLVISVEGEADRGNCGEMRSQIAHLFGDATGRVALDLGRLTFLCSSGIRALIECHELAAQRGLTLEISRAHENVRQVLTICGLTNLFHLRPADRQPGS